MKASDIELVVKTEYLAAQSSPEQDQYVFSYTITITNHTEADIQLLTREWRITDADGKLTKVAGDGVVGKQPHIAPGEKFTYTSGTVLTTPVGSMEGSYGLKNSAGEAIALPVPTFSLAVPNVLH